MATAATLPDSPVPRANPQHWEWQYLDLMRRIWDHGDERIDRTGIGMLWFLTGRTNIRDLCAQGVEIWTDWPLDRYRRETGADISRADFSKRIVESPDFAERWGDLGPVYGKQWTDWPVYEPAGEGLFRKREQGINQVAELVEALRTNPGSRRHIIEGWNVAELGAMALPPCHKSYQFYVSQGKLSGLLYQRSCDLGLGFAFNMWSLALLTRMLAQQAGLEPGEVVWMGGDVHLYLNHAELVEAQLAREPSGEARMDILRQPNTIFDYRIEDFAVSGYAPQAAIIAPVAV